MNETPQQPAEGEPEGDEPLDAESFSLEALSAAYAQLIEGATKGEAVADPSSLLPDTTEGEATGPPQADETGDVTPTSILEAMLFVGSPTNEPLTSEYVSGLLRGVSPAEVDELVAALNSLYAEENRPYRVESVGAGYVLKLRPKYGALRDKFYGRVREARLSQAAIDVLAIVAYRQPLTRPQVDRLRGRPSGAVLSQLVRRQLLRIERPEERPRQPKYFTTDRFLDLFGLEGLSELPESHEYED